MRLHLLGEYFANRTVKLAVEAADVVDDTGDSPADLLISDFGNCVKELLWRNVESCSEEVVDELHALAVLPSVYRGVVALDFDDVPVCEAELIGLDLELF